MTNVTQEQLEEDKVFGEFGLSIMQSIESKSKESRTLTEIKIVETVDKIQDLINTRNSILSSLKNFYSLKPNEKPVIDLGQTNSSVKVGEELEAEYVAEINEATAELKRLVLITHKESVTLYTGETSTGSNYQIMDDLKRTISTDPLA